MAFDPYAANLTFPQHCQSHHIGGVECGVELQQFLSHILSSRGGKTHQRLLVPFSEQESGECMHGMDYVCIHTTSTTIGM